MTHKEWLSECYDNAREFKRLFPNLTLAQHFAYFKLISRWQLGAEGRALEVAR